MIYLACVFVCVFFSGGIFIQMDDDVLFYGDMKNLELKRQCSDVNTLKLDASINGVVGINATNTKEMIVFEYLNDDR